MSATEGLTRAAGGMSGAGGQLRHKARESFKKVESVPNALRGGQEVK